MAQKSYFISHPVGEIGIDVSPASYGFSNQLYYKHFAYARAFTRIAKVSR
ncbi:MAG: hypothetical protein GWN00_28670 [Aliifodinibius sp.]|nr:hypothetical protein [Fodinibius sp.]NIV14737.1 hypothetical protein [Fodinibius sp.]NIY28632.1 hypothetical protein [Fodinibius sp.]